MLLMTGGRNPHEKHGAPDPLQGLLGREVFAQVTINGGTREVGIVFGQEFMTRSYAERQEGDIVGEVGTNWPTRLPKTFS